MLRDKKYDLEERYKSYVYTNYNYTTPILTKEIIKEEPFDPTKIQPGLLPPGFPISYPTEQPQSGGCKQCKCKGRQSGGLSYRNMYYKM